MTARRPSFPYVPKSTAYMQPGDFWQVPLSDGRFACGRVLQIAAHHQQPGERPDRRQFLAGLINWVGEQEPTAETIAWAGLLAQGRAHIKTIAWNGGQLLGHRPLEDDGIEPELERDTAYGPNVQIYRGFVYVRHATVEDHKILDVASVWGLAVIRRTAEKALVRGEPLLTRRGDYKI